MWAVHHKKNIISTAFNKLKQWYKLANSILIHAPESQYKQLQKPSLRGFATQFSSFYFWMPYKIPALYTVERVPTRYCFQEHNTRTWQHGNSCDWTLGLPRKKSRVFYSHFYFNSRVCSISDFSNTQLSEIFFWLAPLVFRLSPHKIYLITMFCF